VSTVGSNPEPEEARNAGRIGRRIGIALFWSLGFFVIGMSAASIIPSLYFPDAAPIPRAEGPESCARELDALERDLLGRVAETLERAHTTGLERFLTVWDGRALALAGGCGPLESARQDLLTLRTGVGSLLTNYRAAPLTAQRRLRSALEAWNAGQRASERPKS
jgi:hypothetical protein